MSDAYTLTQDDVDGCRRIVAKLEEFDRQTGGYYVGNIQGHQKSATATVHYRNAGNPYVTAEAVSYVLENAHLFGLLAKKVIAHCETRRHGWGECAGCGWVQPLTVDGTMRPHDTGDGQCGGSGERPRREVNHA